MIKTLLAAALMGLSLGVAPVALADGSPGCSSPCVIDDDATQGDFADVNVINRATYRAHETLDDNAFQDMPIFDNVRGSWGPNAS